MRIAGTKAYPVVGSDPSTAAVDRWHAVGEKVLRYWQENLRLGDWRITLRWNDDRAWDFFGMVTPADGRPEAGVLLWSYLPDEETMERTIVHELTHLVLMDLCRLGEQWREQLPEEMRVVHDAQWSEQIEQAVDHIAMAFDALAGGLISTLDAGE